MAVKSVVLRMIVDNSGSIGAIFRCAAVVARNTISISVVNVSTIFLVVIRYKIIGRTMVEIMVMLMTIIVGDHSTCYL